jgi:hypothetical protein
MRGQEDLGGAVGARGEQRKLAMAVGICDVQSRVDSDHNPWDDVTKDFFLNDIKPWHGLAAWLYKVNYNSAVARTQHTRRNFDDSRKGGRVANCPDAFRTVTHGTPEVLLSLEFSRQRLAYWQMVSSAEALPVQRTVEVITCVNVPIPIASWHHDEKLALPGTANPQRRPEIGAFADRHRVSMFTGNWLEFHQANLRGGQTALAHLIKKAAPHCQLVRRGRRRVNGLIPQPSLKRLEIVLADELLHYSPPTTTSRAFAPPAFSVPAQRRNTGEFPIVRASVWKRFDQTLKEILTPNPAPICGSWFDALRVSQTGI